MRITLLSLLLLFVTTAKSQDTLKSEKTNGNNEAGQAVIKSDGEAEYPGGTVAWKKFLGKNLHYPDEAIGNEIQGDIVVQFQVDELGNLSEVRAISGPKKGGLREGAVRVINISGKWNPASRNGIKIKSTKKETISFRVSVQK